MDQELAHVRLSLQVPIYIHIDEAHILDSSGGYARYMAFMITTHIYNGWTGHMRWLEVPFAAMQEMFNANKRHDARGDWRPNLSQLNEETGMSRDVTDEEVLAFGASLNDGEDPTGIHLLTKFRTNQLISQFQPGAIQLGYRRQHFQARISHARWTNPRDAHGALKLRHAVVKDC